MAFLHKGVMGALIIDLYINPYTGIVRSNRLIYVNPHTLASTKTLYSVIASNIKHACFTQVYKIPCVFGARYVQ